MPQKKRPRTTRTKKSKNSKKSRIQGSRILEIGIAVIFGLVVLYVISMSIRVSQGVSRTLESPDHEVRLQVLNACGINGLAARVADRYHDYTDEEIRVLVVDTDNFELRDVKQSFVISRTEDKSAARELAALVGVDPNEVVYKPLEHNYRGVTASLILGADWPSLQQSQTTDKEK